MDILYMDLFLFTFPNKKHIARVNLVPYYTTIS